MGVQQHIQHPPRRGELGGAFRSTHGERLALIEIREGKGFRPKKIKTKKHKKSKRDESVVIVFHDAVRSQEIQLTPSQLKRKINHYREDGRNTSALESALKQANRFRFSRH